MTADRAPAARRLAPVAFSLFVLGAVAWPALSPDHSDGFPISNYPMFASARDRENHFHTAVGITASGAEVRLAPRFIGGTAEVVHATETVRFAIGDETTASLCHEIATRLGSAVSTTASDDGPSEDRPSTEAAVDEMERVEIRTETFDAVGWFEGDERPTAVVVHSECDVA